MNSVYTGLSFTGRIAHWSAVHRWVVLLAAALVIVLAVLAIRFVGTETRDDDSGVGESGRASELLNERFAPLIAARTANRTRREGVIFSNLSLDANDPLFRDTVVSVVETIRSLPQVIEAESYYDTQDASMFADDGNAVLASIILQNPDDPAGRIEMGPFVETVRQASKDAPGFEIGVVSFRLLQDELDDILNEDFGRIMLYSLGIGLIILVLAFRALVAAVIPLVMAVGSIFTAIGIAALISQVYPLVELYVEMILLMGLAVGIDYSLFIVSRYRTERSAGREKIEAITVAANTTGRAVFYAGVTVVLSLAGLTLTRDFTFISMALGLGGDHRGVRGRDRLPDAAAGPAFIAGRPYKPTAGAFLGKGVRSGRHLVDHHRLGLGPAASLGQPDRGGVGCPHDTFLFHEPGLQRRRRLPSRRPGKQTGV
ncbi:MAG: MMPL family transporter [Chloroflexi bacterium]|nr:MMPL family transporter [Chloroflexota bacterium]